MVAVWDLPVRAFHWLLVSTVAGAALTGFFARKSQLDVHVALGTFIAGLIVLRLIWGFTGSTYARWSSFVCGPATVLRYLWDLLLGRAGHHLGHNPLGGLMILILLVVLMALAFTGAIVLGGVLKEGPLAAFTSYATGRAVKEVHEALAFALLGLIGLHVAGVLVESLRTRENLARAMLTGSKTDSSIAAAAPAVHTRPWLAAGLAVVVLAGSAVSIAHLAALPARGLPTAALPADYVRECKACHAAHHPSLAAATTWQAIMSGLVDHFGENASLDPALVSKISGYLNANSAEHWDTTAANRLREPSAAEPLRITATHGWKRLHRKIPADLFSRTTVGGKLNCSNCHRDAEAGRFAPRAIAIPKEKSNP